MTSRYLLRQPTRLEILAVNKLPQWIETQVHSLTTEAEEVIEDPTEAEEALSEQADFIRERIECNAPRIFHDRVLNRTIATLYYLLEETELNIIARVMVESLFTKHVTSISINYDKFIMFQNSFVSRAHLLTGLVHLGLHFQNPLLRQISADVKENIIKLLKQLPNLTILNLSIIHTNDILKCVVDNCPLIEELVLGAHRVSNDAIELITKLRNLRRITFRSAISSHGIMMLLAFCKNIESIHVLCENSKLAQVIKKLAASKNHANTLYNLKTFISGQNTVEDLDVAFRKCPLIEDLTIYPSSSSRYSRDNILTPITNLRELRELKLFGHNFYTAQVSNVLQVIGSQLENLELVGLTQLDLNAIIDISQMCPNLQSLTVKHCVLVPQTAKPKEIEIPPFAKLEKIKLDLRDSFSHLNIHFLEPDHLDRIHESVLFILSSCLNIEYIDGHIPCWLTEEVLLKVMEKNPLTYLREFILWQRMPGLAMPVFIEQLIKNGVNQPEVIMFSYNY